MSEIRVTIANRLGMHARAAACFVQEASRFQSEVWLIKDGNKVDGKSMMSVMMLAAAKGDRVILGAQGEDEEQALLILSRLIGEKFGEDRKGVD
ncbi:MAG: HPr family phosphocarrier protein [Magnetococcus sp. DMHC-6]